MQKLARRWRLSDFLVDRLIVEIEQQNQADRRNVFVKKLVKFPQDLLDGVTDIAKIKKAAGEGDGTSSSLIVDYVTRGLEQDLEDIRNRALHLHNKQE